LDQIELLTRLQSIEDLPTLPDIAVKVMELLEDPGTSAAELGKVLSADQGLTLRILRMANSAYYNFPRQIGTINLAIVVLGFETVKSLTLAISINDTIKKWKSHLNFDFRTYWRHSLDAAVCAKVLSKSINYKVPGEAFVAGLIHDVGKLLIARYFQAEYSEIEGRSRSTIKPDYEIETEVLGADHAEIGGWLADRWNLPSPIADAVKCHHLPDHAEVDVTLSSLICLANSYARKKLFDHGAQIPVPDFDAFAWNNLKMRLTYDSQPDIEYYYRLYKDELNKSDTFLEHFN
jgi:HD-like signal output (HDOD) protein